MTIISAIIGATSAYGGAALSAVRPDTPTGPVIVLLAFAILLVSVCFGSARGLLIRALGAQKLPGSVS
jgi:manganese/zinc/iron transport system permease protein